MNLIRPGIIALCLAGAAVAQPVIARSEGSVFVDPGQPSAHSSLIRTESGRAEVRLRNTALFVDERTSMRVVD